MTVDIRRSARGFIEVAGKEQRSNYSTRYDSLTIGEIEEFCIQARMNGAAPTEKVSISSGTVFAPDRLRVSIPARLDALPELPSPGRNARLNRRLALVAFVSSLAGVAAIITMLIVVIF